MYEEPQNPESREAVAYRLELVRESSGLGKQAIAETIGMTPQTWTAYASGRVRIDVDPAMRLCRRYSVTLDWLYRGNWHGVPPDIRERLERKALEWTSKGRQKRKKSSRVAE